MTTTRLLAETEQLTESGASSGDAPGADGRHHRVYPGRVTCHFCRRSRRPGAMQFNDLSDRWECKDEVDCAVAGQWT